MLLSRHTRRRDLVALLGCAPVAWPLVVCGQESPTLIGFLSSGSSEAYQDFLAAFRRGLEVLGYAEARNLVIETRWADGRSTACAVRGIGREAGEADSSDRHQFGVSCEGG